MTTAKEKTPAAGKSKPPSMDVYSAIAAVMKQVKYVQKESVRGLPYTIKSEGAVISACRETMLKEGLLLLPTGIRELRTDTFERSAVRKGKAVITVMTKTTALFTYTLHHCPSETEVKIEVLGEGEHEQDKSVYLAMTGSKKYALLTAFLLETGDDPDQVTLPETEQFDAPPAPKPEDNAPATKKALDAWNTLVSQAEAMGIEVTEGPEEGITTDDLRSLYRSLLDKMDA